MTFPKSTVLVAVLFLLFNAAGLYAQKNINKTYQIVLIDGATIETHSYEKKDNRIQYNVNGLPGFVSLDLVADIIEIKQISAAQLKKKVLMCLKLWEPLDVSVTEKSIRITTSAYKITERIYTTIILAGLSELVYSLPNGWSNIEEIMVLNSNRTSGYVFEGGKEQLDNLTKIPITKANSFILAHTHEWGHEQVATYKPKPFSYAGVGEYWRINDENVALLKFPAIPSGLQAFKEATIIILSPGANVEIIGANGGWRKVFIINDISNKRVLRGWILVSTVKYAQHKQ